MSMDCTLYAASLTLVRECTQEPEEFIARLAERVPDAKSLALRKTWHCLHFVLSGTAWEGKQPLGFLVSGGQKISAPGDDEDEAYSPPRLLPPAFVKRLAKALGAITTADFRKRFDLRRLSEAEIYPRIWNESRTDLLREYQEAFKSLRQFVLESAERGDAIVVELCS